MAGANILKAQWGKACASCGPGGDGPDKRLMLAAALLGIAGAIVGSISLMEAAGKRGTRILGAECRWDRSASAYEAHVRVENAEAMTKIVQARVQARLRPGVGQRWPSPAMRDRYAATSQRVTWTVAPGGVADETVVFAVPGIAAFQCSARAWIMDVERQG